MGVLAGLVLGVVLGLVLARRPARGPADGAGPAPTSRLGPAAVRRLVDVMDPAAVVLDGNDRVLLANASARGLGIVRTDRISVPGLLVAAAAARTSGIHRCELALPEDLVGAGPRRVGVQAARLDSQGLVALLVHDVTEARRVEDVRRDFVANVGHDLKTPVGALTLLAEAVQDAADDPEAIKRFSARMRHEAQRLARLVTELIDLSRLQGGDPLPALEPVRVEVIIAEATDRTRLAAVAKQIDITAKTGSDLVVRGVEAQLVTALTNLLGNAVAYSSIRSHVAVTTRARSGFAEISVTDTGVGIPDSDRDRIFERFYRVDPARASATGGHGLGLAIVKHIITNHGGVVEVWSEPGVGSTFTMRVPLAPQEPADLPPVDLGDSSAATSPRLSRTTTTVRSSTHTRARTTARTVVRKGDS